MRAHAFAGESTRFRKWERALSLLDAAAASGRTPRTASYNLAIGACAATGEAATALATLRKLREAGGRPSLLTYNGVLRVLAVAKRWRQAMRLVKQMKREGVRPTLISFNLALDACAKGGAAE